MSSHHPANLKLQPFDHAAVIELAERAAQLGVMFHINGIPFGAEDRIEAPRQKLSSDYASLDVKFGRTALAKALKASGPKPIVITGMITEQVSGDDGESAEFGIDVLSAVIPGPIE